MRPDSMQCSPVGGSSTNTEGFTELTGEDGQQWNLSVIHYRFEQQPAAGSAYLILHDYDNGFHLTIAAKEERGSHRMEFEPAIKFPAGATVRIVIASNSGYVRSVTAQGWKTPVRDSDGV